MSKSRNKSARRRIVNYRPMCFLAAAVTAGALVAEAIYGHSYAYLAIPLTLGAVAFALLLAFKKARRFFYIPLALLVGVVAMTCSNAVYDANLHADFEGTLTARIASEIVIDGETAKCYVTDLRINGDEIRGDATLYLTLQDESVISFDAGDIVSITGTLSGCAHDNFSTTYGTARANGRWYVLFGYSARKIADDKLRFPLSFTHKVKQMLHENCNADTSEICQALLFGDKLGMDPLLKDNISKSGLAHVLAVSGLHIAALATALYFVLKKLKVNPKIAFVAVLALTFLYSMLCSFSASSLRAVLMSGVFNFASITGRKRDNLSALSLAAVLILTFRPTEILDMGYLLSFFSMLGIFLLYPVIKRPGMALVNKCSPKRHIGRRLVEGCSVAIAANVMTYPFVALFFGKVPTMFLLSSIIVLPYVMALYIILLVLTVFALITTLSSVLGIMNLLFLPFLLYVKAIGSLPFATLPAVMTVAGTVFYLALATLASDRVMLRPRTKFKVGTSVFAVGVLTCFMLAVF